MKDKQNCGKGYWNGKKKDCYGIKVQIVIDGF
jgi:hypothetical protein